MILFMENTLSSVNKFTLAIEANQSSGHYWEGLLGCRDLFFFRQLLIEDIL